MTQGISPAERAAEARSFYRAVYGRMQHTADNLIPIWRGPDLDTRWVEAGDEDSYVKTVSREGGGSVYTPVRLRSSRPNGPTQYGGGPFLAEMTEALFIDWDIATGGKPDGSDGQAGYAHDKETLRGLLAAFAVEVGVPAHAVVDTPNGYHSWHLTEPMTSLEAADYTARFDARLTEYLAEQGYLLDKGVTTTPTRVGRAPGAYHSKRDGDTERQTEPVLVRTSDVSDAPATPLSVLDELPVVLRSRRLPVVDSDLLEAREQFASLLPVSRLLKAAGWEETGGRVLRSPIADASPDAAKLFETAAGTEVLYAWSDRGAQLLGTVSGGSVSSSDLVAHLLGDYRAAQRLWERAAADASGKVLDAVIAVFEDSDPLELNTAANAEKLTQIARRADDGWPKGLDRHGQARLAFRGVSPDVAKARGYASEPGFELPGHDVHWALRMPVHLVSGREGATTQARVAKEPNLDSSGKPKRGPGRPRKDGSDVEPVVKTAGFGNGNLRGLAYNPLQAPEVFGDSDIPLVVVTQDEPGDDTNRSSPDRYAQVQADAVLSASRHERLDLAVAHAPAWVSLFYVGGEGDIGSRDDQLHNSHRYVRLEGRKVYLASRSTWRRDKGLTQYISLLQAKGAVVHVLDIPRLPSLRPSNIVADTSTWGIDDHLAEHAGTDPLRRLIGSALGAEEAYEQAHVPNETATAEMADVVVRHLAREKTFLYDATSRQWARDMGTHLQVGGARTSPNYAVRQILLNHDVEVKSAKVLNDVIRAAQDDVRVQISTTDLDQEAYELPVQNGIVDLRTGRLRKRERGHLNSKFAPVVYDPEAKAPNWEKFLAESMLEADDEHRTADGHDPDNTMVDYLQRIAGLTLIGEMIEEVMFFFVGGGRNGKSTFLNLLFHILGPYAHSMPVELLASKATPFQMGDLRGVRLLLAPEAPRGMRMSEGALKAYVTRDWKTGEQKFGKSFQFQLGSTLISAVNHRPAIFSRDEGTWRRIPSVPWDNQVSDEQADRGLEPRLRAEASGILAWAVRGATELLARIKATEETGLKMEGGLLNPPARAIAAWREHKESTDLLGRWLDEECTQGANLRTPVKEVHVEFREWLEEQEEKKWAPATIRQALEEVGIRQHRTSSERYYVGLSLEPSNEEEGEAIEEADDPAEGGSTAAESNVVELSKRGKRPAPKPLTHGATALAEDEEEL